jgi:hypothetical protein
MTKNCRKNTVCKSFISFFDQKLQFTFVRATRETFQPSKENIQHFKKRNNINFVLCLWVIFALLDPDSDCESGFGSRDPTETGSNPDPDPQDFPKLLSWLHVRVRMQVHQLDIILCALDDYSTLLRERLHTMLQVCSLSTKVEMPKCQIMSQGDGWLSLREMGE